VVVVVIALVLLGAATLALRISFLTPRLAHWDAVNYALALHEFNIAAHQPHPPGSPYFVLLGRAALAVVGDDNAALILITLVASVGAVLGTYALARLAFGARAAVLAALVLMTQPIFWGYGTTGSAWTVLALLAVVVGVLCLLLVRGHARLVIPSALVLGTASGFRLDATVFLAPLWLWALFTTQQDWRRRLAAIALVVACVAAWLVPVAASAGGLTTWSERLLALLPSADAGPGAGVRQFAVNTAISFGTLALVLGPTVLLGGVCDRRTTVQWLRKTFTSDMGVFWALWIAPAFVFLWLVDSTEPGHDLIFIAALVVLGVGLLAHAARSLTRLAVCGAVLVGVQAAVFLFAAPVSGRPFAWTANSMLLNVTAPGFGQQQRSLDWSLQTIRSRFDPGESVVVTLTDQDPYRFMMYYLPEYLVLRLDPQTTSVLAAHGKRQGNWTQASGCLFAAVAASLAIERLTTRPRLAAWVVSSTSEAGLIPDSATLFSGPEAAGPFQVWEVQLEPSTPDHVGFKLGGQCGA